MKKLKIALFDFVMDKPVQFKVGLFVAGVLAGVIDSGYADKNTIQLSQEGMGILLAISTAVYAFMLTLYRIFQRLFRVGRKLPERIRDFDEREIIKSLGIFGLIPFGISLQVLPSSSGTNLESLGAVFIIQGISLYMGAWMSQVVKK